MMRRRIQGAKTIKGWEDKQDCGLIPDSLLLLLLLWSGPAGSTQRYYITGRVRRGKIKKTQRSRSEEKVVGFSSASLFHARKGRQPPRVEPGG